MSNIHKKIKNAGNNIIKNTNININKNIPSQPVRNQIIHKSNKIKNIQSSNNNTNINNGIKQKKKMPLTPSINQREKNILLMQDPSGIPGNGLWCKIPQKNINSCFNIHSQRIEQCFTLISQLSINFPSIIRCIRHINPSPCIYSKTLFCIYESFFNYMNIIIKPSHCQRKKPDL